MKYYLERLYPYLFSIILVLIIRLYNIDFANNALFNNALDAVVNLDSIIIGFMGAIMPVILSMKNESKFVKYVFEMDKEELFKKYLKITIIIGIINAGLSILMYLRNSLINTVVKNFAYNSWLFSIILFLFLTSVTRSFKISDILSPE